MGRTFLMSIELSLVLIMHRNYTYRITAIIMAFLVFLSTTGFSIDMHYCQDHLVGLSLFGKAQCCGKMKKTTPCHKSVNDVSKGEKACHHDKASLLKSEKDDCCHNQTVSVDKSDVDSTIAYNVDLKNIQMEFVAALVAVYFFNFNTQAELQTFVPYKPPLPERDVLILYQTFLI